MGGLFVQDVQAVLLVGRGGKAVFDGFEGLGEGVDLLLLGVDDAA